MFNKASKFKSADRVLGEREKVAKAIKAEESKLLRLIVERVDAERGLAAAETAEAIGEPSDAGPARKTVENIGAVIDRQERLLTGLRSRVAQQASELAAAAANIKAALPEYARSVRSDFETEYTKAVAAFSAVLGKRRALENLVGKFDLPEPQPVTCDLGNVAEPWRTLEELTAALDVIAGWGRAAIAPEVDRMGAGEHRPFDPEKVYVLTRPYDELPSGALVMEACFAPGVLDHLVQVGCAVAQVSQQWRAGLEAGSQAAQALAAEETRERQAQAAGQHPTDAYDLRAAKEAAVANLRPPDGPAQRIGRVVV